MPRKIKGPQLLSYATKIEQLVEQRDSLQQALENALVRGDRLEAALIAAREEVKQWLADNADKIASLESDRECLLAVIDAAGKRDHGDDIVEHVRRLAARD